MEESGKKSIHADSADIDAGGDVKFVGGNEYLVAGDIINIDVATPSYGAKIENLKKALSSNRFSMREDLQMLERKVRKGLKLSHGEIRALIKDIITSGKNIEKLIPAIKMNGGEAKSLPFEADTINRINNAITKGQKEFKEKELSRLYEELPEAREQKKKAETWQLFRSKEQREIDVFEATKRLREVENGIDRAETFLEHAKRVMKYEEPEIPTPSFSEKRDEVLYRKSSTKTSPKSPKHKEIKEPKLKGTLMKKKKD